MEPYDIFMLAVLGGSILFGAWKGLAWQLASIAALVVSYFVAFQFREPVSRFISAEPPWNRVAAMAIIYLVCSLGIWIAFGFVRRFIDRTQRLRQRRFAAVYLQLVSRCRHDQRHESNPLGAAGTHDDVHPHRHRQPWLC